MEGRGWKLNGHETRLRGFIEAEKRANEITRIRQDDPIETWMDDANCRGVEPEAFFPFIDQNGRAYKVDQPRRVCGNCGVRPECANYALKINANAGMWAGVVIYADRFWRDQLIMIAKEKDE